MSRRVYRHGHKCSGPDCDTSGLMLPTGIDHERGCSHPDAEPVAVAARAKRRTPGVWRLEDGSTLYVPEWTVTPSGAEITFSSVKADALGVWTLDGVEISGVTTVSDTDHVRRYPLHEGVIIGLAIAVLLSIVLIAVGVGR